MRKYAKTQPQRGRPVKNTTPKLIPDTPEYVARAIMPGPPKKEWDYVNEEKKKPLDDPSG